MKIQAALICKDEWTDEFIVQIYEQSETSGGKKLWLFLMCGGRFKKRKDAKSFLQREGITTFLKDKKFGFESFKSFSAESRRC